MYPDPSLPDTREATPRRWRLRRRPAKTTRDPSGLFLQSLDRSIDVCDVLSRPLVGVLMTEDFCWRTAVQEWQDRKPRPWRRTARSAWRAERCELDEKRARIREFADELYVQH
jgi:hypothetical protein